MINKLLKVKGVLSLILITAFCMTTIGAVVGDNDGAAFITKAEFDSLKNDFQTQIDNYNSSIDNKIDGAIASYLAGIKFDQTVEQRLMYPQIKQIHFYSRPNAFAMPCDDNGDIRYDRTKGSVVISSFIPGMRDDLLGMKREYAIPNGGGSFTPNASPRFNMISNYTIQQRVHIIDHMSSGAYGYSYSNWYVQYKVNWYPMQNTGTSMFRYGSIIPELNVTGIYSEINGVSNVLLDAMTGVYTTLSNTAFSADFWALDPWVGSSGFSVDRISFVYSFAPGVSYRMTMYYTTYMKSGTGTSSAAEQRNFYFSTQSGWTYRLSAIPIYDGAGYLVYTSTWITSNLLLNPNRESWQLTSNFEFATKLYPYYFKSAAFTYYRKSTETPFYIALNSAYASIDFGSALGWDTTSSLNKAMSMYSNNRFFLSYSMSYSTFSYYTQSAYNYFRSWIYGTGFRTASFLTIVQPEYEKILPLSELKNQTMANVGEDIRFHEGIPLFEATDTGIAEIKLSLSYYVPRLYKATGDFTSLYYISVRLEHYNVGYDSTAVEMALSLSRFDYLGGGNMSTLKYCDSSGTEIDYAQFLNPNDITEGEPNPGYKIYLNVKKGDVVWIRLTPLGPSDGLDSVQIADFKATITI